MWLRSVEDGNRAAPVLHVAVHVAGLGIEQLIGLAADLVGGAVVDAQRARAAADVYADLGPGEGLLDDALAEIPGSARRKIMGNKGEPWGGYQIHWRSGRARSF